MLYVCYTAYLRITGLAERNECINAFESARSHRSVVVDALMDKDGDAGMGVDAESGMNASMRSRLRARIAASWSTHSWTRTGMRGCRG
jgi:hypothetical protein